MRLPRECYQMQKTHLWPQLTGLVLWVWGAILAPRRGLGALGRASASVATAAPAKPNWMSLSASLRC